MDRPGPTVPGAALKAIAKSGTVSTSAKPLANGSPSRANGFCRAASMMTIFTQPGSATNGCAKSDTRTACSGTSTSRTRSASTGTK
jgi:hypothetical protein